MRVPDKKTSIAYFEDLGMHLEEADPERRQYGRWRLKRRSGDVEHYKSLLDLWAAWLHTAQNMINEDDTYRAFLVAYKNADDQRRDEIRHWVEDYWAVPLGAKLADHALTAGWGRGTDHLPRNWKRRVKRILAHPEENLIFPYRALLFFKPEARMH